jgi:hypothetical protein
MSRDLPLNQLNKLNTKKTAVSLLHFGSNKMLIQHVRKPVNRFYRQPEQSLSPEQRSSLRKVSASASIQREKTSIRRAILAFIENVLVDARLTFSTPKHNAMCQNYGHVIRDIRWTGQFPNCADCGKKITDQSQLRKSTAQSN